MAIKARAKPVMIVTDHIPNFDFIRGSPFALREERLNALYDRGSMGATA
jgi:hypothetical protein